MWALAPRDRPCAAPGANGLLVHSERHWPLYAAAGTASFLLAGILAEALAQPEAAAMALFLATGRAVGALAQPPTVPRLLHWGAALACSSAAWLWSFALVGALCRQRSAT